MQAKKVGDLTLPELLQAIRGAIRSEMMAHEERQAMIPVRKQKRRLHRLIAALRPKPTKEKEEQAEKKE